MFKVALVSMPWPLLRRPSLQIGTLKAFLLQHESGLKVDGYPLYLDAAQAVGPEVYRSIASAGWVAEAVYGILLQPERISRISTFVERRKKERGLKGIPPLEELVPPLRDVHHRALEEISARGYDLVGVSVSLSQLTSSLYFIQSFKQCSPGSKLVAGGTSCAGELGQSLLEAVEGLDFVVDGEGERPLLGLVRFLKGEEKGLPVGVRSKDTAPVLAVPAWNQVEDLDQLPIPDFSDYFARLRRFPGLKGMVSQVPVEMSRGCWWNSLKGGCRFCNLNLQWKGFRRKSASRMAQEIRRLSETWECLDFFFTDNSLPALPLKGALQRLTPLGMDLAFFGELRAPVSGARLRVLKRAGLERVQVGIEALSSSLLRRMNKGTTAMQNLKMMRDCEEAGIVNEANLILGFPGSTPAEVRETLDNIPFALPYFPPKPVFFWLGHGSHVHAHAREYGILWNGNHHFYREILPDRLFKSLVLMNKGYAGDRLQQKKLWRPVQRALERWRRDYLKAKQTHPGRPLLGYRDGGHFLLIRRRYHDQPADIHRLRGSSRKIYLYCRVPRSLDQIARRFPRVKPASLESFLADLVSKKLVFREGRRFLSLAVREQV